MKTRFTLFIVGLLALFFNSINAQTIIWGNITSSSPAVVCGDGSLLSLSFTAGGGGLTNGVVEVHLPANITYGGNFSYTRSGTGSIVYDNTSSSSSPRFLLDTVVNAENITINFSRLVSCGAAATTRDTVFVYNGTTQIGNKKITPVYNIQSASLSVLGVSNVPSPASIASVVARTIRITNQDFGYVKKFKFVDVFDANSLSVDVNSFTIDPTSSNYSVNSSYITLAPTNDSVYINFDTTLIKQIGDFDIYFEKNETFELEYNVTPLTCGSASGSIASNLYVSWKCDSIASDCQVGSANFDIALDAGGIPSLSFVRDNPTNKICLGLSANQKKIRIINSGNGDATNVLIDLVNLFAGAGRNYIDTASVRYKVGANGALVKPILSGVVLRNNGGNTVANNCNINGLPHSFKLLIGTIPAGDTVWVQYDMYFCAYNYCPNSATTQYGNVFTELSGMKINQATYQSLCGTNYTASNILIEGGDAPKSTVNSNFPGDINAGETKEFIVDVTAESYGGTSRQYVQSSAAYYEVELTLPSGIEFDNSGGDGVRWYTPGRTTFWSGFTIVTNTTSSLIVRFPVSSKPGVSFTNSELVFKLKGVDYSGSGGSCGNKTIATSLRFNPDAANTCPTSSVLSLNCFSSSVNLHCPNPSCVGMVFSSFSAERNNFGLVDNDNNGVVDGSGSISMSSVRKDRLMFGDTLKVSFGGVVNTDISNPTFSKGYAKLIVPTLNTYFTSLTANATIKRASGGSILSGTIAASIIADSIFYDYSTLAGNVFNEDDTVLVEVTLRMKHNTGGNIVTVPVSSEFYVSQVSNPYGINKFGCDSYAEIINLVGYYFTIYHISSDGTSQNIDNFLNFSQGCQDKIYGIAYYLSVGPCCSNYSGGNLFPFEVRRWSFLDTVQYTMPNGYQLISSSAINQRTGGTNVTTNETSATVPFTSNGNIYTFNFKNLYIQNGGSSFNVSDDGWLIKHYLTIRPTGNAPYGVNQSFASKYSFGSSSAIPYTVQSNTNSWMLNYVGPKPDLTSAATNLNGYSNLVTWDVDVRNLDATIPAANNWLYVSGLSNGVTITTVTDGTVTVTPDANGFYQLGTLAASGIKNIQITGDYNLCGKDSIKVYTGYSCISYPTSLYNSSTFIWDSLKLYIQPTPAQIAISITPLINTPTDPSDGFSAAYGANTINMCNEFPMQLQINSAQPSTIYNVYSLMQLPTNGLGQSGLDFVSASGYIEYPIGTTPRPFSVAANAALAVSGQTSLTFNLAQIDPTYFAPSATKGLKGSIETDSNKVILRFKMLSNCNLVSGSVCRAAGYAKAPCGSDAIGNAVTVSSSVLGITGVSPTNGIDIDLDISSPNFSSCSAVQTGTITITKIGNSPLSPTDSIYLSLPSVINVNALNWVSGVGSQPLLNTVVVGTNQIVSWQYPQQFNLLLNNGNGFTATYTFTFTLGSILPTTPSTGMITIQGIEKINILCGILPCANAGVLMENQLDVPITIASPMVGIAKEVSNIQMLTDTTYAVTFNLIAQNYSNVVVANIQIRDTLLNAFAGAATYTVSSYTSTGTLYTKNGYNGSSVDSLLNSSISTLNVGAVDTVQLSVVVNTHGSAYGPFYNSAYVFGVTSLGCITKDKSDWGSNPDSNGNGNPSDSLEDTPTPIFLSNPVLGVAKTVVSAVLQSNHSYSVTYSIIVENLGNVNLSSVQVVDSLSNTFGAPATYTVTSVAATGSLVANSLFNGSTNDTLLLASVSSIPAGGLDTITLVLQVSPNGFFGPFYNSAIASGVGVGVNNSVVSTTDVSDNGTDPDPNGNNNPRDVNEDDSTPLIFAPSSVIGVAKAVSSPTLQSNGNYLATYNVVVVNYGNDTLTSVQVVDNLSTTFPLPTTFTVVTPPTSTGFLTVDNTFDGSTNTNLLIAGSSILVSGAVDTISFAIEITGNGPAGPFNNTAFASGVSVVTSISVADTSTNGYNPDLNANNNPHDVGEDIPTPLWLYNSVLGVAKSVSSSTLQATGIYSVTYKVVVTNYGNNSIDSIQVADNLSATFPLPTTFTVTSAPSAAVLTANTGFNGASNTNLLSMLTSSLSAGQSDTILFTVAISANGFFGPFYNTAFVSGVGNGNLTLVSDTSTNGNNPDPNGNGNPSDANENIPTPLLLTPNAVIGMAKAVSAPSLQPDGTYLVTYTVVVKNYGNDTIKTIQVVDNLASTFPPPSTFTVTAPPTGSGTLFFNTLYNGNTDINLLNTNSFLAAGDSGKIIFTVALSNNGMFGPFKNSAIGTGVGSASGTVVSDTSTAGTNPDPNGNSNPSDAGESLTTDFSLTPNASIGVAKVVTAAEKLNDGSYNVSYLITVVNYGNEILANIQVTDNLVNTFPSPTTFMLSSGVITTGGLTANVNYNGVGDVDLLSSLTSTLNIGDTATISFSVRVYPPAGQTTYYNVALASAVGNSSGNITTDASQNGTAPDLNGNDNPSDVGEDTPTPLVLDGPDIKIPDGFTPNGDGVNDAFVIVGLYAYPNNVLKIFNRWGNLIYEIKGYQNDWDGYPNVDTPMIGKDKVPNGTYFYVLDLGDGGKGYTGYLVIKY
ncbi:MAG: gliding motility-associated C-terminal domain-containing protein [Bacteroidetes bacterium]|nr:gliding motility-associated C-terminal domain-containing protein [Bacteroidota bacterium]